MARTETYFRDPVHNLITFTPADEEDALFLDLIDTPEFQRLRRIRQLGLAELVFQGAEHSRFTHSIGVLHVARRIMDQLGRTRPLSRRDRLTIACAALLHDIGHAPFSHVAEAIFGALHETWSARIILGPKTRVHDVLRRFSRDLPDEIARCLQYRAPEKFYSQIVSSQLDADRLDYLLRDSLMTGVKYGIFDLERIILGLEVARVHQRNELVVNSKGFFAVEEYLQARYHMYRQVYYHKTVCATGAMLKALFRRARTLLTQGRLQPAPRHHPVLKLLTRQRLDVEEYTSLDDSEMLVLIKEWSRLDDPVLRLLASGLMTRHLFKAVEVADSGERSSMVKKLKTAIAKAHGANAQDLLLIERAGDTPYKIYRPGEGESSIYVRQRDGRIKEVSQLSPSLKALTRKYDVQVLCFPPDVAVPE